MIGILVIITWHILYPYTWCLQVQCLKGATYVHKYIKQILDVLELSKWHWEVKCMRLCCCCLPGIVSHQHVFMKMPRMWSKVSFIRSSKMLHATWNSEGHILLCQPLTNERLKSLRKELVISCCGPEHQSACGMTTLSWELYLVQYCTCYLEVRWGDTQNNDVRWNIRH